MAKGAAKFALTERIQAFGFNSQDLQRKCLSPDQTIALSTAERERLIAERLALVPNTLTEHESYFERRTLHAAVATALVGTGVPASRISDEIEKLFRENAIVALDRDVWGQERLSTPEILRTEREIGEIAQRLNSISCTAPDEAEIEMMLAGSHLSEEQREAVRAATRGNIITIIEGAPGSGKSTTLGPIKISWERAGCRVIGSATAWKIANALADDLKIEARATDSWLARAENGRTFLDDKTVLLLDEAGLLSSRQMHQCWHGHSHHDDGRRVRVAYASWKYSIFSRQSGSDTNPGIIFRTYMQLNRFRVLLSPLNSVQRP